MAPICPTSGAAPTVAAYDTEPPLRRGEPPLAASGWRHTTPTDGSPMSSAATLNHCDPRVAAHDAHRPLPDVVRRHPRPRRHRRLPDVIRRHPRPPDPRVAA